MTCKTHTATKQQIVIEKEFVLVCDRLGDALWRCKIYDGSHCIYEGYANGFFGACNQAKDWARKRYTVVAIREIAE